MLLVVVLALAGTLFAVGGEAPSFVIGLWCGATLIQLYFHQFHEPLDDRTAPAPPVGPIKLMSYAIQAKPWAPWPEIVALIVLAGGAFVFLAW